MDFGGICRIANHPHFLGLVESLFLALNKIQFFGQLLISKSPDLNTVVLSVPAKNLQQLCLVPSWYFTSLNDKVFYPL